MLKLKQTLVVVAIAALTQVLPGTVEAANPFEKLIGGAAEKVVGGIGSSIQKNVVNTGRVLFQETPKAILRDMRPQWGKNNSPSQSFQNIAVPAVGKFIGGQTNRGGVTTGTKIWNTGVTSNQVYTVPSNSGGIRTFQTTRRTNGFRW